MRHYVSEFSLFRLLWLWLQEISDIGRLTLQTLIHDRVTFQTCHTNQNVQWYLIHYAIVSIALNDDIQVGDVPTSPQGQAYSWWFRVHKHFRELKFSVAFIPLR